MGDLHSIAYYGNLHSNSSLGVVGWDFHHHHHHNLQVFNPNISHSFSPPPPPPFNSFSPIDHHHHGDVLWGYLEDALFEFNSKRRRLLLVLDSHHQSNHPTHPFRNLWNSDCIDHSCEGFGHFNWINNLDNIGGVRMTVEEGTVTEAGPAEETISTFANSSSSSPQSKSSLVICTHSLSHHPKQTHFSIDPVSPSPVLGESSEKRNKRVVTRVVYPFALVKPGGFKGDMTLNDINERILMRPTRPVKHPVGDYACRPLVSPDGPGLSGKAVVALTKIQTQGRGTITIIRTKG